MTNFKDPIFFNNPLIGLVHKSLPDNLRPRLDRFQDFKVRQNFASMQAIQILVKSFKWAPQIFSSSWDLQDDDDDDDDDDGNKRVGRESSAHGMRLRHADDLGKGSVSLKLNNIFF